MLRLNKQGRARQGGGLRAVVLLGAGVGAWGAPAWAGAQQVALLPDAPQPEGGQGPVAAAGVVTGVVEDAGGGRVAGATVTLSRAGAAAIKTTTDAQGRYRLEAVPAGAWQMQVVSAGQTMRGVTVQVPAGQTVEVPTVALSVAGLESMVQVSATREDIAAVQVELEEKQRVLGFFPNFFVSYIDNPAPMTTKQKFSLTTKLEFDPVSLGIDVMIAGIEQATDTFPDYHQGTAGYFKRLGVNLADNATADYFAGAIYPTIFHQDPRYFYRGPKYSIKHRIGFAVASAFIARGDNGKWEPNYSNVLGDLTSGAISNLYYPAAQRQGARLTFINAGIGLGSSAVTGLIQEFLIRKITPNVPDYGAGDGVAAKR